jgi:hypothetical protein
MKNDNAECRNKKSSIAFCAKPTMLFLERHGYRNENDE